MDREWTWSDEHQDYYRYRQRQRPGKSTEYDLIWGRTMIDRPVTSSAVSQPQHAGAVPLGFYPNPSLKPTPSFANVPPPQLAGQNATGQLFIQQHAFPIEFIQRGNSPVPAYNFPKYGVIVPHEPNPGTDRGSSGSTEGTQAITPTTTVTQSSLTTELPLLSNPMHTGEDSPESLVFPTIYSTLDGRYVIIQRPRNYFKKGRVFMVLWIEPRGEPIAPTTNDQIIPTAANDSAGHPLAVPGPTMEVPSPSTPGASAQTAHAKPRLFVVVRQKSKHCLCVPVYTYSQQATSKHGVNPEDHAPLIKEGTTVEFHDDEEKDKLKKVLVMILEDPSVQWSPMSRINLGKVHSIEYNLKVRTIGRLTRESTNDLEASFREAIGLGDE